MQFPSNPGDQPPTPPMFPPIPGKTMFPPIPGKTIVYPPPPDAPPPYLVTIINGATESCIFKGALSGVAGGGLGLMFGLFFGGYAQAVDKAVEMDGTAAMKIRVGMKEAGKAMGSYAKNFARFGLTFSIAECAIEKVRARHDMWNSIIGGCVAGSVMSAEWGQKMPARARASQMAIGCASVGAFSAAIDYYMEYMD